MFNFSLKWCNFSLNGEISLVTSQSWMSLGFEAFLGLNICFPRAHTWGASRLPSGENENIFLFMHINCYAFVKQKKWFPEKISIRALEFCAISCTNKTENKDKYRFFFFALLISMWSGIAMVFSLWQVRSFLPFFLSILLSLPSFLISKKELSEIVFHNCISLFSVVPLSFLYHLYQIKPIKVLAEKEETRYYLK